MDSQATWRQRMFPWFFREKSAPSESAGEFYYDIWFDGTQGGEHWWFACYDPEGKLILKDYYFTEIRAKHHAKHAIKLEKNRRERIARGKQTPTRYTA